MGREARQRQINRVSKGLVKALADEGRLIEMGFAVHAKYYLPDDLPDKERERCRECFMMGAQHFLGSIMQALEEGTEPTDNDMRRMDLAHNELENFVRHFKKRHNVPDELYPQETIRTRN